MSDLQQLQDILAELPEDTEDEEDTIDFWLEPLRRQQDGGVSTFIVRHLHVHDDDDDDDDDGDGDGDGDEGDDDADADEEDDNGNDGDSAVDEGDEDRMDVDANSDMDGTDLGTQARPAHRPLFQHASRGGRPPVARDADDFLLEVNPNPANHRERMIETTKSYFRQKQQQLQQLQQQQQQQQQLETPRPTRATRSSPPDSVSSMVDFTAVLPEEISLLIFSWLTSAADLHSCSQVSSTWRYMVQRDSLWKPACMAFWKDKFRFGLVRSLAEVPLVLKPNDTALTQSVHMPIWKAMYYLALEDSKRTRITVEEITGMHWMMRFRHEFSVGMPLSFGAFHRNMTYSSEFHDSLLPWRFFDRQLEVRQGVVRMERLVQVAAYPPLCVSRFSDWGFRLRNRWVVFRSIGERHDEAPRVPRTGV